MRVDAFKTLVYTVACNYILRERVVCASKKQQYTIFDDPEAHIFEFAYEEGPRRYDEDDESPEWQRSKAAKIKRSWSRLVRPVRAACNAVQFR